MSYDVGSRVVFTKNIEAEKSPRLYAVGTRLRFQNGRLVLSIPVRFEPSM